MRIGITLNEVVRGYIEQLQLTYEKYEVGESTILLPEEITDLSKLTEYFPIRTEEPVTESLDKFIFTDCSMEILGSAPIIDSDFMEEFAEFFYDFNLFPNNKVTFISKEYNRGINATLFFLAKTNIQARNIEFFETYTNIWDDYDLIITADPTIIETKPEDKRVIKVEASYNKHIVALETVTKASDIFKQNLI